MSVRHDPSSAPFRPDDLSHRFAETLFRPYWQDTISEQLELPTLQGERQADLAIVGAGFTGLWSALKARERHADARILVLEAGHLADAASGRNGGFCAPSISHGVSNAIARWPDEAATLVRLGRDNLDALEQDLLRYGVDAEYERTGKVYLAATAWEAEGLKALRAAQARFGVESSLVSSADLAAKLSSGRYPNGLFEPGYAYVNPAKLVHGLARAGLAAGIEIYAQSRVTSLADGPEGIGLATPNGKVTAAKVILATNAAPPLLRRLRPTILPIYDYTIMTEPLTKAQLAAIGWQGRHGVADNGNRFHYARKTADNRILWGGYDAIYHYGSRRDAALLNRAASYRRLEANFIAAFPDLSDVRFSYAWGGIIDTSARLTFYAGTAMRGRLAYALGFTGQGVSASRFAALTMLDHLDGLPTERTHLRMTNSRPVPFPPEPLRSLAVRWAQADLAREDATGRRSLLLRAMDRLRIGFGS